MCIYVYWLISLLFICISLLACFDGKDTRNHAEQRRCVEKGSGTRMFINVNRFRICIYIFICIYFFFIFSYIYIYILSFSYMYIYIYIYRHTYTCHERNGVGKASRLVTKKGKHNKNNEYGSTLVRHSVVSPKRRWGKEGSLTGSLFFRWERDCEDPGGNTKREGVVRPTTFQGVGGILHTLRRSEDGGGAELRDFGGGCNLYRSGAKVFTPTRCKTYDRYANLKREGIAPLEDIYIYVCMYICIYIYIYIYIYI